MKGCSQVDFVPQVLEGFNSRNSLRLVVPVAVVYAAVGTATTAGVVFAYRWWKALSHQEAAAPELGVDFAADAATVVVVDVAAAAVLSVAE